MKNNKGAKYLKYYEELINNETFKKLGENLLEMDKKEKKNEVEAKDVGETEQVKQKRKKIDKEKKEFNKEMLKINFFLKDIKLFDFTISQMIKFKKLIRLAKERGAFEMPDLSSISK